jgi:hypothetical protein
MPLPTVCGTNAVGAWQAAVKRAASVSRFSSKQYVGSFGSVGRVVAIHEPDGALFDCVQ